MDIVDVINVFKRFNKNLKYRHIGINDNISTIKNLTINKNNIKILNKYKKYLTNDNYNVILYCIRYKINVFPIIWKFDDNTICTLIYKSIYYKNKYMLINLPLIKSISIHHCICSCLSYGNLTTLKIICKQYKITREYILSLNISITDKSICKYLKQKHKNKYKHMNIIYRRHNYKFVVNYIDEYQLHKQYNNYSECKKILLKKFKLYDIIANDELNYIVNVLKINVNKILNPDYIKIFKYYHKEKYADHINNIHLLKLMKPLKSQFSVFSDKINVDIVKYLYEECDFTKLDLIKCNVLEIIINNDDDDILSYLHENNLLDKFDYYILKRSKPLYCVSNKLYDLTNTYIIIKHSWITYSSEWNIHYDNTYEYHHDNYYSHTFNKLINNWSCHYITRSLINKI